MVKDLALRDRQNVQYQLGIRQADLSRLCVIWQRSLNPDATTFEKDWGPSKEELERAWVAEISTSSVSIEGMDDGDYDPEFENEVNQVLDEHLEGFNSADYSREGEDIG
jgi:hypothetical protein